MHSGKRWRTISFVSLLIALGGGPSTAWAEDVGVAKTATISSTAYGLLLERVKANRKSFFIYEDDDSGFNHGFPSGFFGTISQLSLDTACLNAPSLTNGCTDNSRKLDRSRGTAVQIIFGSLAPGQFAGINFEIVANVQYHRVRIGEQRVPPLSVHRTAFQITAALDIHATAHNL